MAAEFEPKAIEDLRVLVETSTYDNIIMQSVIRYLRITETVYFSRMADDAKWPLLAQLQDALRVRLEAYKEHGHPGQLEAIIEYLRAAAEKGVRRVQTPAITSTHTHLVTPQRQRTRMSGGVGGGDRDGPPLPDFDRL